MMEAEKEVIVKKEFKVNELISLKLQWNPLKKRNETMIYVGGEPFRQCKYLFIMGSEDELNSEFNSIDEMAENLNKKLEDEYYEVVTPKDFGLTDEDVFWGHCSNLQVWAEHDYDTRLLHSNLSFPLLKKLVEIGDLKAIKMFKDEVAYRYAAGGPEVRKILYSTKCLEGFSLDEIAQISLPERQYQGLKEISEETRRPFEYVFKRNETLNNKVERLQLFEMDPFPKGLLKLKDTLEWLVIDLKSGVKIPEWIGELKALKRLVLHGDFTSLPESIKKLKNLWLLSISGKLTYLSESIGNLKNLIELTLSGNQLSKLPVSVRNLTQLTTLALESNKFEKVPEEILSLKNLKVLDLRYNPIVELPKWLISLELVHINVDEGLKK